MTIRYYFLSIIGVSFVLHSYNSINSDKSYLGQKPPGDTPELFAPSIINTDSIEINTVFNSSFTELFFTRIIDGSFVIHHSELINGNWTEPRPIQLYSNQDAKSVAIDPSITQDGNTMYFLGISPEERSNDSKPNIYKSQKINGEWQIASKVEYPVSTDEYAESYPVVVADGSLYFTSDRPDSFGKRDIYRAQYLGDGKFDTPVNIGSKVNSEKNERSTYVSPDESFLITMNTYTDEKGFAVSFKKNNIWQTPSYFDLGEPIVEDWIYFCPYMSPDGKYFFFSKRYSNPPNSGWKGVTKGEVYWVNADVIFNHK
ncbi:putative immunogenic 75 kDa protein PG4 [Melioribacter roseus P3M-2]|uniref:Putative immunogenic 75 kDa protein PG4 n=1 Tax=Melioribacter roseus (strain DSM 23840 / JCM 17771 / VKM B-2668 / P3M-2) TaxID=1191523 RepID=I6Z4S1_MELRP|nr:PD40 domain-containing protein [Melioribacter roseus]AFN74145.1 putative immunogenic 75 kDa protein PG4 [Melioribacter roseus P3M-2]